MGSGKSTVGKALARKINYPFYDADHEIENRCGVDIPTIFEFEGEAGFREREKKMLAELTGLEPVVLATGGGAILKRSNRKLLRDNGHVIMLSVEIEEQLRRVSLNKKRPLLQGGDVEAKLRTLMEERYALYEKTAHHIVSTNSDRMQRVVASIYQHLVSQEIIEPVTAKSSSKSTASKTNRRRGKTATSSSKKTASKGTTTKSATKSTTKNAAKTGKVSSTASAKSSSESGASSNDKQAKRTDSKPTSAKRATQNAKELDKKRSKRSNVKKKV